ncbi:Peptidyl-prolyl cis-trans isomerase FKBP4 [Nymphon striatum]|nr:Peptidyl-prolyl cis-trans isomerase FKBP4 [Nymphon striatum]
MSEEQKYVPSKNAVDISEEKDGGLYKEIVKEGTIDESPSNGNNVTVHYVGTLLDGTEFDSSRSRGDKFKFDLGKGSVIKGWDVGVATMKKGEVCKLICRSDYAYGAAGSPPKIPPNATLVFEVELFEWSYEDLSPNTDGSIQRKILTAGTGYSTPNNGAIVNVHLIGKYNGKIFEERDVNFEIGDGFDCGVVTGLETALQKFKKDEKSLIVLESAHAFGNDGNKEFGIPPGATVEYEVTLNSFEKMKETWEFSDGGEKLEQAKLMKQKGTEFFKVEKYALALKRYKKVEDLLENETKLEGEQADERKALLLAGYLNVAVCELKFDNFHEAKKYCEKALEQDSKNIKGLFRKGQAYFGMKDFESALKDFLQVIELDPTNKTARNQASICQKNVRQLRDQERMTYRNMFDKFAAHDAKNAPVEEEVKIQKDDTNTDDKEPWEDSVENIDEPEVNEKGSEKIEESAEKMEAES